MKTLALLLTVAIFSSCTLSFQNVSTYGTAEDLIDDNLTTSPEADVSIPVAK